VKFTPVIFAGVIYAATMVHADAHCYRFWFYKIPQNCGVRASVFSRSASNDHVNNRSRNSDVAPAHFDIPLPDLSAAWDRDDPSEGIQRLKALRRLSLPSE
jgi:hypothetical protein